MTKELALAPAATRPSFSRTESVMFNWPPPPNLILIAKSIPEESAGNAIKGTSSPTLEFALSGIPFAEHQIVLETA